MLTQERTGLLACTLFLFPSLKWLCSLVFIVIEIYLSVLTLPLVSWTVFPFLQICSSIYVLCNIFEPYPNHFVTWKLSIKIFICGTKLLGHDNLLKQEQRTEEPKSNHTFSVWGSMLAAVCTPWSIPSIFHYGYLPSSGLQESIPYGQHHWSPLCSCFLLSLVKGRPFSKKKRQEKVKKGIFPDFSLPSSAGVVLIKACCPQVAFSLTYSFLWVLITATFLYPFQPKSGDCFQFL